MLKYYVFAKRKKQNSLNIGCSRNIKSFRTGNGKSCSIPMQVSALFDTPRPQLGYRFCVCVALVKMKLVSFEVVIVYVKLGCPQSTNPVSFYFLKCGELVEKPHGAKRKSGGYEVEGLEA